MWGRRKSGNLDFIPYPEGEGRSEGTISHASTGSLYLHGGPTVNRVITTQVDICFVNIWVGACYSAPVNSPAHLDGLNKGQKEAALHTKGPLLIVAGAGTGKTKTITHRIAHLIEEGVPARNILGVTFTNKAAGEMRERVHRLLPHAPGGVPLLTTFHSFGVRTLREFHKEAGVPRAFSIWDRDDSLKALKRILESLGLEEIAPKNALAAISREKGKGTSMREYADQAHDFRKKALTRAWEGYEAMLQKEGALDFDDLLLHTLSLLRRSGDVLSLLRDRYTHLTIDEYQDTNTVQMETMRLLAGEKKNICAVGDIDQNIYSWRGADIAHLLSFEETFPGARTVVLEQNYRSTRTILTIANAVIEKNVRRKPKHLFTESETGEPAALYAARNETDEAWFVVESAQRLIREGTPANEIAVLFRENFQSRVLEEAFLTSGIPYRVLGTRFFERKEVKDVLSYIRAALNPRGTIDMRRIVGVPTRGIGKTTLEKMLSGKEVELRDAARVKVVAFRGILADIKKALEILPASEAVRFTIETSGIEAMLKQGGAEERERLENVRELVNLSTRYDDLMPPEGIERLLEEAALQSEQDTLDETAHAVSLMTVHASKGLEFDAVFITGLEQGLFPSMRENDPSAPTRDSEEERRLFYVALTRARKRLFLSCAGERMKYGSREYTLPSEFLEDIDQRLIQSAQAGGESYEEEIIR